MKQKDFVRYFEPVTYPEFHYVSREYCGVISWSKFLDFSGFRYIENKQLTLLRLLQQINNQITDYLWEKIITFVLL